MKRLLSAIISVLLCAAPVLAGYPEGYAGDRLPDGCHEVEAWIVDWHDMNPWGQYSPVGTNFWFGELCVDGDVAILEFESIGTRVCKQSPWGGFGNPEVCSSTWIGDSNQWPYVLVYDQGLYESSVAIQDENGDPVLLFEALTYTEEQLEALFVTGAWKIVGTIFLEDDDRYTRTKWRIRQRQTPLLGLDNPVE